MAQRDVRARIPVELARGVVEVSAHLVFPSDAWVAVAVAHGAGAGMDHPWMMGFTDALNAEGVATVRFAFPYSEAGRRMPGPAAHAIATWSAVQAWCRAEMPELRVWAAGKSYGGRMASMAAAAGDIDPAGLVYLGYPYHPPGAPEKTRGEHLPAISAPQLFVEGTRDRFIDPRADFEAAVAACQNASIEWIEGGGHSFEVAGTGRDAAATAASLVPLVTRYLRANG